MLISLLTEKRGGGNLRCLLFSPEEGAVLDGSPCTETLHQNGHSLPRPTERERGREEERERCKSVYSDAHLPSFIFKNAFCERLVFRILPGTLELFDVEADRWNDLLRRCLRTNTHIRKDTHKQNRQVMANVCQHGLSMKKSPTHTLPESHVSTLVTVGLKDWSAVNKQRYLNTNGIKMYSHQRTIHTTASIHAGVFFFSF